MIYLMTSVVFSISQMSGYFQQFSIIQETKSPHCPEADFIMPKTLTKILSTVTLRDQNPTSEQAYRDFKSMKTLECPMAYILVVLVQEALLLSFGLIYYDFTIILAQSVLIVLTICSATIRKKLGKHIEPLLFTFFCITHILGIVHLGVQFQDLPKIAIYVQSYFLGVFQHLLMIWMFRFNIALIFSLLTIILRCFISIFISFETTEELSTGIIGPICIDLAFLFVMFNIESNDRKMFKRIQTYASSSLKGIDFEQMLIRYMPHSILVLTSDIKRALFINNSYEKMIFNQTMSGNTFRKPLENLIIKKNNFNAKEKFASIFEEGQTYITLYTFLERIFSRKILKLPEGPSTIYASHLKPQVKSSKKLYEVTIFQLAINGENSVAVIFNDITEQKSLISIKAADSSKDKLLATISHELKTPLHGVLGGLNHALQASRDPEVLNSLNLCRKSAKLLSATVNSILDLQLFRRNRLSLRFSKINLKTVLEEIESLFDLQCNQKGLTLTTKLSTKIPTYIQTDKDRLCQTLIHLISNSIKFTRNGEITVRVDFDPDCEGNILFEVKDTGVGIKPEDQSNISMRMYGKDEDEEEDTVGTHGVGLGLTISNYLAKLLNPTSQEGGVKCKSEHNKGSTFSFSIANCVKPKRDESIEEDMASFFDDLDEFDIEARIGRYSQKRAVASRNFVFSRLNISAGSHSNDQDEFCMLNICSRNKDISFPFQSVRENTNNILISPKDSPTLIKDNIKDRKGERNISIIVTPPDSGMLKTKTEATSSGSFKGWVLIVDDNPFNLMVARKMIEDMGFCVKTANDGEDAILKTKEHLKEENESFKLILMDCQMPIMDGYDCTKRLRMMMMNNEIPHIPIVALTANDTEEDVKKCLESGMNDVLSKPLKEDDIQKIQSYLKDPY